MRVWVLGLSDIGRSPRLQNHAVSLATQADCVVDVIAQRGSQPLQALLSHENITVHYIPALPAFASRLPGVLRLAVKAIIQAWLLFVLLFFQVPCPHVILLQVPPAIPTIFLGWLVSRCRGAKLIIDWHNFGFTLMAMNAPRSNSALVTMARWHEKFWGRLADGHLCVSRAMKQHLASSWSIDAVVFYDKAPMSFVPACLEDTHSLFRRLEDVLADGLHPVDSIASYLKAIKAPGSTVCTEVVGGVIAKRRDRPAIVVSSTSWTPDEDFSLLLEAAVLYDSRARKRARKGGSCLPTLLVVVTGKGPQKEQYVAKMRGMDLRHVAFRTLWLASEDYPVLLGSADLGISLHRSSSGLDLPMKVVDMFGCGLPVLSYNYSCIGELVQEGQNGGLFSSAAQLASRIEALLCDFPDGNSSKSLEVLKENVLESRLKPGNSWESCWEQNVLPVVFAGRH